MAARNNDDIAAALAGLAGGEDLAPAEGAAAVGGASGSMVTPPRPMPRPVVAEGADSGSVPAPAVVREVPTVRPAGITAPTPPSARRAAMEARSMGFKQTLIPPLLALGVLFVVTGILSRVLSDDWVMARLPTWLSTTALAAGGLLLALGAVNIQQVKKQSVISCK